MNTQLSKLLRTITCLLLLMLTSSLALAKPDCESNPSHPSCGTPFSVAVVAHDVPPLGFENLYNPGDLEPLCLGESFMQGGVYNVLFGQQSCAALTTNEGLSIGHIDGRGYIVLNIHRQNRSGLFDSAWVQGMANIEGEMLVHVGDEMIKAGTHYEVEEDGNGGFILHLHADKVMLSQCNARRHKKKVRCDVDAGTFAIEDLYYFPPQN